MFRKKPPKLTVLEELKNCYQDVCNYSIKNLTLEEQQQFDQALKGWKSLHTSLLYKIDYFEKSNHKYTSEESDIMTQLKLIRDQNVKHLIRVQLRLDEVNRKTVNLAPPIPPKRRSPSTSPSSTLNQSYQMRSTVRNHSGNHSSYSPSNGTATAGPRPMLKSLRANGSSSSTSKITPTSKSASQAATVSWSKPKPAQTKPVLYQEETFAGFDQDTYEFNNWEKIENSRTSSNISDPGSVPLINLDDDADFDFISNEYYHNPQFHNGIPNSGHDVAKSFDDLTIKPVDDYEIKPKKTEHLQKPKPEAQKKPYVYNKPQPLNIQQMMQRQRQMKSQPSLLNSYSSSKRTISPAKDDRKHTANKSTQPKPSTAKTLPAKKPGLIPGRTTKSSNIQYNYVKSTSAVKSHPQQRQKTVTKPTQTQKEVHSPTMDDLLGGYDDIEDDEIEQLNPNDAHAYLTKEEEQTKLIESIRGIDLVSAKQILNDIVVHGDEVYWDDIVGLESAKSSLKEAVVYPFLRPDLFKGLREPTRGMLLFGPPGTGKTMLARAVATESKSTFFSINPSSLTSKYLGESEKLVKALFLLAKKLSPSIVFIDEIDSLLSSRAEGENDSTRRIKNEFLVQWSELSSAAAGRESTNGEVEDVSRVLILGATNLPWSIDEAARRRFVRRQYIPLPEDETRKLQIQKLLKYQKNTLSEEDYTKLIKLTDGFSGSDITALAKDSAMGPLRSLGDKLLLTPTEQIRPINIEDFEASLKYIRPSVSKEGLKQYEDWAIQFGSSGA
jgi:adenosinetriphosphatase